MAIDKVSVFRDDGLLRLGLLANLTTSIRRFIIAPIETGNPPDIEDLWDYFYE